MICVGGGGTPTPRLVFCMLTNDCIFAVMLHFSRRSVASIRFTYLLNAFALTHDTLVRGRRGIDVFPLSCTCNIVPSNIYRLSAMQYTLAESCLAAIATFAPIITTTTILLLLLLQFLYYYSHNTSSLFLSRVSWDSESQLVLKVDHTSVNAPLFTAFFLFLACPPLYSENYFSPFCIVLWLTHDSL